MIGRATSEARAERVIEKLQRASARYAEMAERKRQSGAPAIGPDEREEIERFVGELWHEDCEWFPLIAGVEGKTSYQGRDGLLAFYEDFWGTFEVIYRDPEFRAMGNSVVYLSSMGLRGRESGVELARELGIVYTLDGDLIRTGRAYDSHAAALAAAEELDA
jgi:hypothetical protein